MQSLMISCIARRKKAMNSLLALGKNVVGKNVVGHAPIHLSRTFYRFLKLPGSSIS